MTTSDPVRVRDTRPIRWLKAARRDFDSFPAAAQSMCFDALTIAAEGSMSRIAKPLRGFGPGVFEVALSFRGDAYRVVYAVQIGEEIWVVHAFQKKSTQGIKTSQRDLELIRQRLKMLKESLGER